jgi:hypothetical protein
MEVKELRCEWDRGINEREERGLGKWNRKWFNEGVLLRNYMAVGGQLMGEERDQRKEVNREKGEWRGRLIGKMEVNWAGRWMEEGS